MCDNITLTNQKVYSYDYFSERRNWPFEAADLLDSAQIEGCFCHFQKKIAVSDIIFNENYPFIRSWLKKKIRQGHF